MKEHDLLSRGERVANGLMTAPEAASLLGISKARAYELIQRHEIPHYRIGRLIRLRTSDLDAFLASRRVERTENSAPYARYPAV